MCVDVDENDDNLSDSLSNDGSQQALGEEVDAEELLERNMKQISLHESPIELVSTSTDESLMFSLSTSSNNTPLYDDHGDLSHSTSFSQLSSVISSPQTDDEYLLLLLCFLVSKARLRLNHSVLNYLMTIWN